MARVYKPKTTPSKARTGQHKHHKHASKPAHRSKSKPRRSSIVSPTKIPRGPILITYFPNLDEVEDDDDPAQVPSDVKEFKKRYTPYAKMKVLDLVTRENVFGDDLIQINDFIQIRAGEVGGKSVENTENWYAQVIEIGARKEPDWPREDVCLQVAWFYSQDMLKDRVLSTEDRKLCGNMMPNELIPSDHYDIVHLSSLMGRVNVTFFNEHSQSQPEIESDELFYRRRLENDRILMSKDTCTARCKAPYNPARDIQHYCPRDQCRRWYHTSCMVPNKHHQEDYRLVDYAISSVEQLLLDLVLPDTHSKKFKPRAVPSYPINASSETEPEPEAELPKVSAQAALSLAQHLPSQIRALATGAITRGVRSGNGIAGSVWVVVMARWLARQAIVEGKTLTPEDTAEVCDVANKMNSGAGVKLRPMEFECPGCGFPI
ncbi:hypothetical protein FRC08_017096 [Ceratobasidium sp. 394]|nr:hypothetical protein FRC08_017096 [Ceratobasidium sp. 394]